MIVHPMLMHCSVDRIEDLLANVSAGPEGAIESSQLSHILPRSNRNPFNHGSFGTLYAALSNRWRLQCERCFWLLRVLRPWVACP